MEVDYRRVSDTDGEMTLSFTDCKELTRFLSITNCRSFALAYRERHGLADEVVGIYNRYQGKWYNAGHSHMRVYEQAFRSAERVTDVTVAFIFIDVPKAFHASLIMDKLEKAKDVEKSVYEPTEIVTAENYIEQMIEFYNREVELCSAFLHEYFSIVPFIRTCMPKDFDPSEEYYQQLRAKAGYYNKYSYEETPVLRVRVGDHDVEDYKDINKAIKIIRYKYWNHLFHNEKFTELLTSDMRQKLYNAVSSMDVYDFNAHNIQVVQEQFITSLLQNLEQTILSLFE